ncbi:hypothetical protein HYU11_04025 [Candidatus Woesearchaeota archaeon]|nr:hypothetical protein [Candidatus Woesearchaeota archaeon]
MEDVGGLEPQSNGIAYMLVSVPLSGYQELFKKITNTSVNRGASGEPDYIPFLRKEYKIPLISRHPIPNKVFDEQELASSGYINIEPDAEAAKARNLSLGIGRVMAVLCRESTPRGETVYSVREGYMPGKSPAREIGTMISLDDWPFSLDEVVERALGLETRSDGCPVVIITSPRPELGSGVLYPPNAFGGSVKLAVLNGSSLMGFPYKINDAF